MIKRYYLLLNSNDYYQNIESVNLRVASNQAENGHKPRIIVAMPAYNEEKYIGTLILQVKVYADEVIVVDDGSTDHTAEVARLAGSTVISHQENRGKGAAVQTILSETKNRDADILVLLDADSQHNPAEIPALIQPLAQGYDIVIGSRELNNDNRAPAYRRLGQKVLLRMTRILSGTHVTDSESGFRAFSRQAIDGLTITENGFAVESEMISNAVDNGLKITEVPITVSYDGDGSTLNPVNHGLSVLLRILVMIFEHKPLTFFGLGGLALMVAGVIAGIRVLEIWSAAKQIAYGTALIAAILIITGAFSIFTGIILFVVTRHDRPHKK